MLFDLLYLHGQSLLREALAGRRARLQELLARVKEPLLVYSGGVQGCGREFFARVVAQGHEGVMAKRQTSRYQPGQRSQSWRKIKPAGILPCVVIGFTAGREGVQLLLLAALHAGVLHYVGRLRMRWDAQAQATLARRLAGRRRSRPVLDCAEQACGVEPELYCRVTFHGWTAQGHLRGAAFAGWIEDAGSGNGDPRPSGPAKPCIAFRKNRDSFANGLEPGGPGEVTVLSLEGHRGRRGARFPEFITKGEASCQLRRTGPRLRRRSPAKPPGR